MVGISKKSAVHIIFFGLISSIVVQSRLVGVGSETSLLHQYISGEEVSEGPLNPSAYAQTNLSGNARLASVDSTDANFMTFNDPAVQFGQTLEGNAVVAPMQPAVDSDSPTTPSSSSSTSSADANQSAQVSKPFIYTVEDGDTIAGIAAHFGISVSTVLAANGLHSNDIIKSGDHITILPKDGILYAVKSGDTLLSIANTYGAKASEIIADNNLPDSDRLSIGQQIMIPNATLPVQKSPTIVPQNTQTSRDPGDEPTPAPQKDESKTPTGFGWPTVTHHISQYFGHQGHTGIDIDNRSLPPVFAAQDGTVEFAGWLGAYGNLIIINHGNGLTTYYAHLSKFYVAKGQQVSKGAAIAKMGSTGNSTGPHVHFEVRRFGQPINPLGMY